MSTGVILKLKKPSFVESEEKVCAISRAVEFRKVVYLFKFSDSLVL